ncbi:MULTISPECIES: hypothetical protein [Pseudomonas]|uniref:hypothetical protein n=1 Tax=Pseudomonas TaxID=286 RepID=UPI0006D6078E|nr:MULTISPECIES: hypothetical protein [Pseudomonas]KAA8701325.1 hypothetical protein F4W70_25430 [Pseudomonas cannabina]KTC13858.1 hypothetical protein AO388_06155 [Pseudomonas sp. ICMP 10191]SDR33578.1 hypothetical protein SAMN05216597_3723 [Pseudomonas cannabina]
MWLFERLFYTPPPLPTRSEDFSDYRAWFLHAVKFTNAQGFKVAKPNWLSSPISESDDFLDRALLTAGVSDASKSAFQCLKWSHFLAPHIEASLGRKVYVTIGQLWRGDTVAFNPSWEDLKRWCKRGISLADISSQGRQGINLHVWLTVESGQIIDVSLPSSLARIFPDKEYGKYLGGMIWGIPPQMYGDYFYLPMAVGSSFAEAIGSCSELKLIARNSNELNEYQYAFVRN